MRSELVYFENIIINIECSQIKFIAIFFAKNLNDFNIYLFGQTLYCSVSILLLFITLYANQSLNESFECHEGIECPFYSRRNDEILSQYI